MGGFQVGRGALGAAAAYPGGLQLLGREGAELPLRNLSAYPPSSTAQRRRSGRDRFCPCRPQRVCPPLWTRAGAALEATLRALIAKSPDHTEASWRKQKCGETHTWQGTRAGCPERTQPRHRQRHLWPDFLFWAALAFQIPRMIKGARSYQMSQVTAHPGSGRSKARAWAFPGRTSGCGAPSAPGVLSVSVVKAEGRGWDTPRLLGEARRLPVLPHVLHWAAFPSPGPLRVPAMEASQEGPSAAGEPSAGPGGCREQLAAAPSLQMPAGCQHASQKQMPGLSGLCQTQTGTRKGRRSWDRHEAGRPKCHPDAPPNRHRLLPTALYSRS